MISQTGEGVCTTTFWRDDGVINGTHLRALQKRQKDKETSGARNARRLTWKSAERLPGD
jgi:hypothetical protein